MRKEDIQDNIRELLIPIGAIILGLLVGAVIMLAIGANPIEAYKALFIGAFGDMNKFANTLARSTPLIFTGLAVAFAFRCGLFNIGVEGQLYVGALAAAFVGGNLTGLPKIIHLPLTILAGMAAGGLWAAIPGFLKAKRGVHEVINTIMMNFIAYALIGYLVADVLKAPGQTPRTVPILPSATLIRLGELVNWSNSRLSIGFLIGLIACAIIYFVLWKTTIGYEVRSVGLSPLAAEYGGINSNRKIILAMVISGALGGLAGAERVLGFDRALILGFSPGFGFEGIAVALLGRNHPVGVLLGALLFGALSNGGAWMNFTTSVPVDLIVVLQAVIIFFVAADQIIRVIFPKKRKDWGAV
ncbi:ABC transporter permease [Alkaliphilus hydrothermalis]|uniref:Simple sugar transport system permease protein n=1 Tax=Alkaliphilus hydrothermalis TaxID=1482730 RepID=A0ABS2NM98_9FIRM|nr:ABC transporter permease [Alkaliphilus hydrothermalis]MBM7614053.1 simple sugar transport system permease protein [Alkaliphilus hydrothermalis]